MIRALLLLAALAFSPSAALKGPVGFPGDFALKHRIGGETTVEVPYSKGREWYGDVDVDVTIGIDGNVTDARIGEDGNPGKQETAPALAAARALKFRPFTYRGDPVVAVSTVPIRYIAGGEGRWRDPNAEFPPIDYTNLKITLTRSACFGSCPDYKVTIDGAGNVVFSTRSSEFDAEASLNRNEAPWQGVLVLGTHRTMIDRATLDALIGKFRAVRFFGLRKEYRAGVTDNPTYVVGFESAGRRWQVEDYVGLDAGMPVEVTELEKAIDLAAGTARWVNGDASTVPALLATGFDPRGEEARRMAGVSAMWGNGRVAMDLIAAGMPLNSDTALEGGAVPLGAELLEAGARRGNAQLFALLAEKGWLGRMPRPALDALFASTGGGCDPAIARAMVAAGANPGARTPDSKDSSAGRRTALMTVLHGYVCDYDRPRAAVVKALLELGVDIDAVDSDGSSAIFGVEDPDLLGMLLAAGARVDLKDKEGNSAAFGSWTDVIVLRLLDAGADPRGFHGLDRGGLPRR